MKRALTILAMAAIPVFADEPAKTTTAAATAPATQPIVTSGTPVSEGDSPLVAAAKRSNRGKKTTHKITNANLGRYGANGARITTTSKQEPIYIPPSPPPSDPTPEMKAAAETAEARKKAAFEAEKKKKEDAEKRLKDAAAAERNEEGMYGETDADVGYGEGQEPQPAQPKAEKKPPQF